MKDSKEWLDCAVLLKRSAGTVAKKPAESFSQDKYPHNAEKLISGPEQRSYVLHPGLAHKTEAQT
jgi:hypothetical protein